MSLYQCDKCGCVENSALGHYHSVNVRDLWPDEYVGKKLCSECGPPTYRSGEVCKKFGKWHDAFEKKIYPLNSLYTDDQGNIRRKSDGKYHWEAEDERQQHTNESESGITTKNS